MFLKIRPALRSIIIGASIIMFWRGLWGLMDLYIFPENEILSYVIPAIIGLLILFLNDFRLTEIE